jgi:hypothetical protein
LLLPYVSADYTLIQLYFPLVFFLNARRVSRWDVVYVALFGILLVPVDYYYILHDISISVIIYPAALVALVLLAILDVQRAGRLVDGERSENRGPKRGRGGEACGAQSTPTDLGLILRPPAAEHRGYRRRGHVLPPCTTR